jgi:hypothetical protein
MHAQLKALSSQPFKPKNFTVKCGIGQGVDYDNYDEECYYGDIGDFWYLKRDFEG